MSIKKNSLVSFDYHGKQRLGFVDSDDGYYMHVTEYNLDHPKKFIWDDIRNYKLLTDRPGKVGVAILPKTENKVIVGDVIVFFDEVKDVVVDVAKGLQIKNGNLVVNGVDKGCAPKELLDWANAL